MALLVLKVADPWPRMSPLKAKVGWKLNCNRVRIGTDQPLKCRNRLQLLSLQIRAHLQRQVMNNSGRSSFLDSQNKRMGEKQFASALTFRKKVPLYSCTIS